MSRSQMVQASTKVKKQLQHKFSHILKQNFVMFPEYIYKSFDIYSQS